MVQLAPFIKIIDSALKLLPESMGRNRPKVLSAMLTIGLQESLLIHKYQVLNGTTKKGPARGFWQFELGGGLVGLVQKKQFNEHLQKACKALDVPFDRAVIWQELEHNDVLAAVCARLLLYSDPAPLPELGDAETLWNIYLRTWRPGAYDRGSEKQRKELKDKFFAHNARVQKELA